MRHDGAEVTPLDEDEVRRLLVDLRGDGNRQPLIALLRTGEVGPERVRGALRLLAEADPDLLVQITLDALIDMYVTDPGLAHQTRRFDRAAPLGGLTRR